MSSAITGGVKFFELSKNLFSDGATAIVSSGGPAAKYALDKNPLTFWRTSGSNDTMTESFEVDFPAFATIDRILLLDHNWKQYTIQYDDSGVWTNFQHVSGLNSQALGGGISESVYAQGSSYYEFDAVTTRKILITVTLTQVSNQEKYVSQIISTKELGTVQGFPMLAPASDKNVRDRQMLSGKHNVVKSTESFAVAINWAKYPSRLTADLDLCYSLFDRDENFLVWLCGGRTGAQWFGYPLRGFRLVDVFSVQVNKPIIPTYSDNVYKNTVNFTLSLVETP